MSTVNEKMTALANSIRLKSGESGELSLDDMKTAVDNIVQPSGTLNITTNGAHDVKNYASVNVSVETSSTPEVEYANAQTIGTFKYSDEYEYDTYNFYFIEGMTWAEFIDSEMNTYTDNNGNLYYFVNNGEYGIGASENSVYNVALNGSDVMSTDLIINQQEYVGRDTLGWS